MSRKNRVRLGVEKLEDRATPATTAFVNGFGDLVVAADAASNIAITQTGATTFDVTDGGAPVGPGTFTGVTRDVRFTGSAAADTLLIDLGGNTTRNILTRLGNGANSLTIQNGSAAGVAVNGVFLFGHYFPILGGSGTDAVTLTGLHVAGSVGVSAGGGNNTVTLADGSVGGLVSIVTGGGTDSVVLGDGTTAFSAGLTLFTDVGGAGDTLTVNGQATLRSLATAGVNDVTLQAGSTVTGSVAVTGGFNAPNSLTLSGRVDQGVAFVGNSGVDTLTLAAGASTGGGLRAVLFGGNDVVTLDGNVGGSLFLDAGFGGDVVNLNGDITGNATVLLGFGNDTLSFAGRVGATGVTTARLSVEGGAGDDTVNLAAGSAVNGQARVNLGGGNDTAILDDAATFVTATIDGGPNLATAPQDTFQGTKVRTGLTLLGFETFI